MANSLKRLANRLRRRPDFDDCRSRKVVLLPHCIFNQNARSAGAAERPAAVVELVSYLLDHDIGILQMPCPEIHVIGLDRGRIQIEKAMRTPPGKFCCRNLARDLVQQVRMYRDGGIQVLGVLGKNGSPSCGVEETWENGICPGTGAFIEELKAELDEKGIFLPLAGIQDCKPDVAIAIVDRWLRGQKDGPSGMNPRG
jgi:predicted secreted protein